MSLECSNLDDGDRLMTLIKMSAADMAGSISNRGHSYALSHCSSRLNAASNLSEILGGMTQVFMGI
jgi:Zn-dependent M16 (insulinase) family peptidase